MKMLLLRWVEDDAKEINRTKILIFLSREVYYSVKELFYARSLPKRRNYNAMNTKDIYSLEQLEERIF